MSESSFDIIIIGSGPGGGYVTAIRAAQLGFKTAIAEREYLGGICLNCVEGIKGLHPHPMNKLMIPGCTYCTPQVASVGLTEQACKDKKLDIRVGRFPFVGNGKAIALGEDQGLVKVIFDKKTGQLLGAQMVGAEVTELIQGYVVAMNLETTEEELMHTVFPHPTLSEMMKEAVLDAYGRVLNA
jgi:dihydrolipoamide dehydrogenase